MKHIWYMCHIIPQRRAGDKRNCVKREKRNIQNILHKMSCEMRRSVV